jgi:hypothetical protein
MGWTLHPVPSQRSATVKGVSGNGAKGLETSLTAVHAEGVEHETPLRVSPFPSVPEGVTGSCIVQVVPFHRSASNPVSVFPTAVQADADVHETAAKK